MADHQHRCAVTTCADPQCRTKMLAWCPVVRMGGAVPVAAHAFSVQTPHGVAVIPPASCINCGICVRKCTHELTSIANW